MTLFPTRVLVGVDSSEEARQAAFTAAELARATASELYLVHAKITSSTLHGRPMTPPRAEQIIEEGEQFLRDIRQEIEEAGTPVAGAEVRYGARIDRVLAQAQDELDAGLLVLGESRTGELPSRMIMHRGASRTVRAAPRSVLVVRSSA